MAFSNTVPDGNFAKNEFTQPAVANQRQARVMIKIILAVACLGLAFVTLGKLTGLGTERVVNGAVVAAYPVTMMLEADDAVALRSVETGQIIVGFDKGRGGFLRNAIRAFGLKRNQMNVPPQIPFVVTRWESGRITLNDPATNHQVPVDSFGPMVTKMFAPLVETTIKN
jgi:putative photosynthetic complex assembly protein